MIVDTSALIAIVSREAESASLAAAIVATPGVLPAPALIEFRRVITLRGSRTAPEAEAVLRFLLSQSLEVEAFTEADAGHASAANDRYGAGNGRGGTLNLLDLMVYGAAKRMALPILCTGRGFSATDIPIHPASRAW